VTSQTRHVVSDMQQLANHQRADKHSVVHRSDYVHVLLVNGLDLFVVYPLCCAVSMIIIVVAVPTSRSRD